MRNEGRRLEQRLDTIKKTPCIKNGINTLMLMPDGDMH